MVEQRKKKRAIAMAGGGPAAGFHIGALKAFEKHGISFDVWSLSCIGAWVGIYYHQSKGPGKADATYEFFEQHCFRDTTSYRGFPVNKAFAPNLQAFADGWLKHATNPRTYLDAFFSTGNEWGDVYAGWQRFLTNPRLWTRAGDLNVHVLNNIMAVHPFTRFLTSLIYTSGVNGLSNIYYPDSSLLDGLRIANLDLVADKDVGRMDRAALESLAHASLGRGFEPEREAVPEIYHNAWRFGTTNRGDGSGALELFNNKWLKYRHRTPKRDYLPISHASLCACSALPYIEQTVAIPNDGNSEYSEGALVDTVSFRNLLEDHPDLDEIWVCRIVDYRQIRRPMNLHDSLGNLCQQFAAEVGENDVRIFQSHLRKSAGRIPRIVEIPLEMAADDNQDSADSKGDDGKGRKEINYRWDRDNLANSFKAGQRAVNRLMAQDSSLKKATTTSPPWPKPPVPIDAEGPARRRRVAA
jgi:predicted acylesterase/phospholipase RssA